MKNIIFDLGVVLINLNYRLTAESFEKLGVTDFDRQISYLGQQKLFDDFEKGQLSVNEFCREIRKIAGLALKDEEIISAWNAMLLDLPEARIELLRSLKDSYRLFLLSNTNAIHIEAFTRLLADEYGQGVFESLFEKIYYSSDIGMRKPDPEIFEYVLADKGLAAEETLFIDDLQKNTEAAARLGIKTALLGKGMEVTDLIQPYIGSTFSKAIL